jgi:hypothetical protein
MQRERARYMQYGYKCSVHHVYGSEARGLGGDEVEGEDTGIEGQVNHT